IALAIAATNTTINVDLMTPPALLRRFYHTGCSRLRTCAESGSGIRDPGSGIRRKLGTGDWELATHRYNPHSGTMEAHAEGTENTQCVRGWGGCGALGGRWREGRSV